MTLPLLVIQNDPTCPTGLFGEWFIAGGAEIVVRRGFDGDEIPTDLRGFAGLIVLGGDMSATDDATCPWLTDTKNLLRTAADSAAPAFGICLGHQLMAEALGGRVQPNPAGRALGLTPIRRTAAGDGDPLLGPVDDTTRAVAWNGDIVTQLPAGAVLLAVNPDGSPQAVRFAEAMWGVQFHPEITAAIFRSWQGTDGSDPQATAAALAIDAAEPELRRTWQPVAERFLARCAEAS